MPGWIGCSSLVVMCGSLGGGVWFGAFVPRWLLRRGAPWPRLAAIGLLGLSGALCLATIGVATGLLEGLWVEAVRSPDTRATLAAMAGTSAGETALVGMLLGARAELGLTFGRPRQWFFAPLVGAAGVLASVVWSTIFFSVTGGTPSQPAINFLGERGFDESHIVAIVFVLGAAPILEELLFRGALHVALRERWGVRAAIGLGGLSFGLLHAADPLVVPPLVVFGMLLGLLRERSGSVWPGVLAHALNNLAALLALRAATG